MQLSFTTDSIVRRLAQLQEQSDLFVSCNNSSWRMVVQSLDERCWDCFGHGRFPEECVIASICKASGVERRCVFEVLAVVWALAWEGREKNYRKWEMYGDKDILAYFDRLFPRHGGAWDRFIVTGQLGLIYWGVIDDYWESPSPERLPFELAKARFVVARGAHVCLTEDEQNKCIASFRET